MGFSCEHFPKVCQSCAPQSRSSHASRQHRARILKEGWRPVAGSSLANAAGSDSSRALETAVNPQPLTYEKASFRQARVFLVLSFPGFGFFPCLGPGRERDRIQRRPFGLEVVQPASLKSRGSPPHCE